MNFFCRIVSFTKKQPPSGQDNTPYAIGYGPKALLYKILVYLKYVGGTKEKRGETEISSFLTIPEKLNKLLVNIAADINLKGFI